MALSVLDSLVDPLHKTINFRPKQDAVKQEVDRNEDMIRSALRAIASLNRIRYTYVSDECILLHFLAISESTFICNDDEKSRKTFLNYLLSWTDWFVLSSHFAF